MIRKNLITTWQFSTTAQPLLGDLRIDPTSPGFFVGVALTGVSLVGSGGAGGPYAFSVLSGSMPTGLTLNAGGTITGTPSAQGRFEILAQVQDSSLAVFPFRVIFVVKSGLFALFATPTPCVRGLAYRYQVLFADATGSTSGITYTIVAGALPSGLTLTTGGLISGTTSVAAATFAFTVRGTKSGSTLDVPMVLVLRNAISAISGTFSIDPALQNMAIGVPVDASVTFASASGNLGFPPYVWDISAGALPAGLSMDTRGRITGTPTAATANTYTQPTFRLTDKAGQTRTFTPSAPKISVNSTLSAAVRGSLKIAGPTGLPTDLDVFAPYFGDASDGDIVLDGSATHPAYSKVGSSYTQLRPVFANSITFGSGVTLNTGSLPTFTRKTDGRGVTGVTIRAFGGIGVGTSGGVGIGSIFFGTTGIGGAGGAGTTTNGTAGSDANPSGQFANRVGVAGAGGRGGDGSSGTHGNGGNPQTGAATVATTVFPLRMPFLPFTWGFGCFAGGLAGGGGGGGGGNTTNAGGNGGGGGGPGGVLYWFSYEILTDATTAWTWTAVGGAGAPGTAAGGANRGAGAGGGAASGGIIWIVCVFRTGPTVSNCVFVDGGDGGLAGTTGLGNAATDGSGASSGFAFYFELSTNNSSSVGIVQPSGRTGGVARMTF